LRPQRAVGYSGGMESPELPPCQHCLELEARVLALEAQVRDLLDKLKPPTAGTPMPRGRKGVRLAFHPSKT
jgi:hypothetical protein